MKSSTKILGACILAPVLVLGGFAAASVSASPAPDAAHPQAAQGLAAAAPAAVVPAATPLDTASETSFVPITPCRIVDTRGHGGSFVNGTIRTYNVGGTTGFAPQGGKSGGCGIPTSANAITATVGVTNTQNLGYLTVWPANLTKPKASIVNYAKGQTIAGSGAIAIQPGVALSLKVFNYGGPSNVFIDVTGYYLPPIRAVIALDATITKSTGRVLSVVRTSTGHYSVTVDRDVTACTVNTNAYGTGTFIANGLGTGNVVAVSTYSTAGTGASTNINFELAVTC